MRLEAGRADGLHRKARLREPDAPAEQAYDRARRELGADGIAEAMIRRAARLRERELARHGAIDLAAGLLLLIEQGHAQAVTRRGNRGGGAGRAGTQHDDVP